MSLPHIPQASTLISTWFSLVNRGAGTVSVLPGNGDGTFRARSDFTTGSDPFAAAVGDLNGDLKLDVAVVNSSSNTVSILLGNGDGTFATPQSIATGSEPHGVVALDVDGDADVVAVAELEDDVLVVGRLRARQDEPLKLTARHLDHTVVPN
jgi:hypothetical protein